ncbi:MAG: hypothetical protein QXL52_05295 [Nitrososphaerales archaeon]
MILALGRIVLRKRALVLDSTAFYAGIPLMGVPKYYTTPLVIREISHVKTLSMVISTLLESNKLSIINPLISLVEEVKRRASESGDIQKLSDTDISIIALGMQLKKNGYDVTIISDDYSIQNLIKFSGLRFSPVMTRGISRIIKWLLYCSGCGKVFYNNDAIICDVCGTRLKRKMKRV